jgi:predicted nucleic acid-binding Zn ribbon protein
MEAVDGAGPTGKRIVVTNRFEAVSCGACGRKVKRKSRQQKFCSDRCRKFAAHELEARTEFSQAKTMQCRGENRGRASP